MWVEWSIVNIWSSPRQLCSSLERSSTRGRVGCSGSLQGGGVPRSSVTSHRGTPALHSKLICTSPLRRLRSEQATVSKEQSKQWNAGHAGDSVTVSRYPLVYRCLGANQEREQRLGGAGLHRLRSKAHLRSCRKQPTNLDRCLCGLLLWVVSPAAASSEGTLVRTRGDRVSITGRAGTI